MMISRRILAAFAILCLIASPAYAQKSKSTLTTEVNTNWPDNTSGAITPALLRSTVIDIINSYVDWLTCTGTGGIVYWNGGTPSCLAAGTNGQFIQQVAGVPAWSSLSSNLIAGAGITITGTISPTIAITNVVTPTTVGAANAVPQITYNTQGEITATTSLSPTVAITNITGVSASSIAGNVTGVTANAQNLTPGQVGSMLCVPVRTVQISGSSATYTTPTCNGITATWLEVDLQGGGSGGEGSGTSTNNGSPGNASSFGALTANGGGATSGTTPGTGGTCSGSLGTQQNFPGTAGGAINSNTGVVQPGGNGGPSYYGGWGAGGGNSANGGAAPTNSGGGGGGGGGNSTAGLITGVGGASGCHIRTVIVSPVAATYTFTVGASANGGSAGTSGNAGGNGAAGLLDVIAHWQ